MRLTSSFALLPLVAQAFVLPQGGQLPEVQSPLQQQRPFHHHSNHDDTSEPWWDILSKDLNTEVLDNAAHSLKHGIKNAFDSVDEVSSRVGSFLKHAADDVEENLGLDSIIGGGHHHREYPDLTIYELLQMGDQVSKFTEALDDFPDIIKILNSTESNHTLFVPLNSAFDRIPGDHEKPSKEILDKVLRYHIGVGNYPASKILFTHTLPTEYDEKFLDGAPQRLRTSVGLGGVRVNFYSKVVVANFKTKNGIIHAVRDILVPPPMVGTVLSLFPSKFSTLLLAMDKTEFVDFIHKLKFEGSTVFAPSNFAFSRLGPRANAFLFNTETGLKYLTAILKYHIAPNATLYTDAFYDRTQDKQEGVAPASVLGREHFDLGTLLGKAHVSVDIGSFGAFTSMRVNGFAHASITDALAKNGVVQVLDRVLIPPHKHKKHHMLSNDDNISVQELRDRLSDYL